MELSFQIPMVCALLGFLSFAFVLIVRLLQWDPAGCQQWNAAKKTALFHVLLEAAMVVTVDRLGGSVGVVAGLLLLTKLAPAGRLAILQYGVCAAVSVVLGLRVLIVSVAWQYIDHPTQRRLVEGTGGPVGLLTTLLPVGYSDTTPPAEIDAWMGAARVLGSLLLLTRLAVAKAVLENWRAYPRSAVAVPPFAPKAMSSQDSGPFRSLVCDGGWFWDAVMFPALKRRLLPLFPLALPGLFWLTVAACMGSAMVHGGWSNNDFAGGRSFEYGGAGEGDRRCLSLIGTTFPCASAAILCQRLTPFARGAAVKGSLPNLSQLGDLEPERTIWRCTCLALPLALRPSSALSSSLLFRLAA